MDDWIEQRAIQNYLATQNHIWIFDVEPCLAYCQSKTMLLTDDEAKRWRDFRNPLDQDAFLVRRVLLKTLIANYLSVSPRRVLIAEGRGRKPVLEGELSGRLEFSVSRSGRTVAIAFSMQPIGIDLEIIRPFADVDNLISNCCTFEEARVFRDVSKNVFWNRFFRLWTGKEAIAKALGLGLSLDFTTFAIPEETSELGRPIAMPGLDPSGRCLWLGTERIDGSMDDGWMLAHAAFDGTMVPEVFLGQT